MNSRFSTRSIILCGLCAAITCVLAPVSIPLAGGVPLSLATFSVMLAGALLGGQLGAASQLIYVLLGAAGLPVFSGWTGGIGKIAGMTGGYIIGYIPLAFLTGYLYHRLGTGRPYAARMIILALAMTVGNLSLYALGTAWFMFSTGMTLSASLAACVLPFLPGDLIKMGGILFTVPPVETALRHSAADSGAAV